jgi:atypical dual specificity phosphatase
VSARPALPLFELRGITIASPDKTLLHELDWCIPDAAVTVLMGPAGTGKSALLHGLSGCPVPAGWEYSGAWRHRGRPLRGPAAAVDEIAWLRQRRAASGDAPASWRALVASGASTLLLDEPTRGIPEAEVPELTRTLRAHAGSGHGVVVVTHDLSFAHAVADRVALLCAGRMIAEEPADTFFAAPPNALAARFLQQGNCWPVASIAPPLPSHFHWVLLGGLAGMGRPGLLRDAETDLHSIVAAGVRLLITLTEDPLPADLPRSMGIEVHHFPIADMGVPAIGPTASLCRRIERSLQSGYPVAVHCHGGLGRTGTILAAMLVWLGRDPAGAIAELRAIARGYLQNRAQTGFVARFAAAVGKKAQERREP